jgi:hypothetical protein
VLPCHVFKRAAPLYRTVVGDKISDRQQSVEFHAEHNSATDDLHVGVSKSMKSRVLRGLYNYERKNKNGAMAASSVHSTIGATEALHVFITSVIPGASGTGSFTSNFTLSWLQLCSPNTILSSSTAYVTSGANFALLRFRLRFFLPLMTYFAARAAYAASIALKLMTFAFTSTTDLVDQRTLASLFIVANI